jgi:hypothetical protein
MLSGWKPLLHEALEVVEDIRNKKNGAHAEPIY